jgi:hypothetical protein
VSQGDGALRRRCRIELVVQMAGDAYLDDV